MAKELKKFDFVIGNPPYQEENTGSIRGASSIYANFMNLSFGIADKVELITPARFLFNAGNTPKDWNKKMLNDEHFKVLHYELDSKKIFNGHDIKGGIAISYYDNSQDFGAIKVFTSFNELNSIMRKVSLKNTEKCLDSICYTQNKFNVEKIISEYPDVKKELSDEGKDKRIKSNSLEKVSLFNDNKTDEDISILGVVRNKRTWKYINKKYIDMTHENINNFKVIVPASNGSGALGEVLSTPLIGTPLIGTPLIGYSQTFISFGSFETQKEAENCLKYIKSKFCRTMLGVLKITQANTKECWKYVPVQDFTDKSDIDWSKSIKEIDQQLYKKYGLSEDEIKFIEEKVKEMN